MTMLARLIGARRAIELGTFTGYSAICIARGLGEGGLLVACELDPERAETARANFAAAGVDDRIEIRDRPGHRDARGADRSGGRHLRLRVHRRRQGRLPRLLRACLELLRPGGLIVLDNVLRGGSVLDPAPDDRERAGDRRAERADRRRRAGRRRDARRRRRDHARPQALMGARTAHARTRSGGRVRIGLVSKWRASGQAVFSRQVRSALDDLGHETFVLARPGSGPARQQAAAGEPDPVWDQPGVTEASAHEMPARRVRGLGAGGLARADPLRRELPVGGGRSAARGRDPHRRPLRLGVLRRRARRPGPRRLRRRSTRCTAPSATATRRWGSIAPTFSGASTPSCWPQGALRADEPPQHPRHPRRAKPEEVAVIRRRRRRA